MMPVNRTEHSNLSHCQMVPHYNSASLGTHWSVTLRPSHRRSRMITTLSERVNYYDIHKWISKKMVLQLLARYSCCVGYTVRERGGDLVHNLRGHNWVHVLISLSSPLLPFFFVHTRKYDLPPPSLHNIFCVFRDYKYIRPSGISASRAACCSALPLRYYSKISLNF